MVQTTIDVEVNDAKGCSHPTEDEVVIDESMENDNLSLDLR